MPGIIGIRREDKNEFERRVPLAPAQVKQLVSQGIGVRIQPSQIRIFKDGEYVEAGAIVQEDLAGCDVVFGVKEFPISFFNDGQAYMFFSHVIKGQEYNMPMLRAMLDKKCSLIDYEKVTDEKNRRLIFFGNYAGLAGMLETLYTLGRRFESEGTRTPLLGLRRPLDYQSLDEAKVALEVVAKWVRTEGLPESISPLVIGFAGYGNVSKGAQEMLDILPTEEIQPPDLKAFMNAGQFSRNKVYKVVFYEKDMVVTKDPNNQFELQDYFDHPEKYRGVFQRYLPDLSALVNCIYWTPDYPMLVTKEWLKDNWTPRSKLKVIGDISCDIEGSIQATLTSTEPGNPVFVYFPQTESMEYGIEGDGLAIMAVDTLPSELPRESSTYFGDQLMPFVAAIANADYSKHWPDVVLPPEIIRAVIAYKGKLTPDFEYMGEYL